MNGFPSDSEIVAWVKACFRQACNEEGATRRLERFTQDKAYYNYIFHLIKDKVSQIRNDVKTSADTKIIRNYEIDLKATQEEIHTRVEYLLNKSNFLFKNPDTATERFQNQIIFDIARDVWFSGPTKDGVKFSTLFTPIPPAMLALIAAGVHCSLSQWASGSFVKKHFKTDPNAINYGKALEVLTTWKQARPREFKGFQDTLWNALWVASGQMLPREQEESWFDEGEFEPEEEVADLVTNPGDPSAVEATQ
ncbi:hypothetical protein NLI96_g13178 [Meripilus lineatus]|uniref:DUF6532 domain-containing protein n=1 Tax=Meripilus lineatus TaxID=2056292 RepID=A0AAD5UQB6_9APHY|nr:hypothetical protein NLI96_g13178 [Physisporinus lineatus]